MVDVRYRNPAWVTNQVIAGNVERRPWSARFRMSTSEAMDRAMAGFLEAGAGRAFVADPVARDIVVEFEPVLVRRVASVAVARGAVLVEVVDSVRAP